MILPQASVFRCFSVGRSCRTALAVVLVAFSTQVVAAPKKAAPALSFRLESRFDYRDDSGASGASQSYVGQVLVSGANARLETSVGGRPVVFIVAPPYFYKILPAAKSARRYRLTEIAKTKGLAESVPTQWMRDPQSLRAMLKQQGAKPHGPAVLDGVAVEVWQGERLLGQVGTAKAWLRRTDALPVKVEVDGKLMKFSARWSDYRTVGQPPSGAFAPPAGFRVRDAQE
jgi:hypothetical protein